MFYEKLIEIGFSEGESKVYLELLKIGPQAVSVIAKRLNMNRSTIYSLIKTLEMKGAVGSCKKGKMMFYAASDPNCLIGYIDRKCKIFDYYRSELLSIIPEIRSSLQSYEFLKPIVSYFEGKEAVSQVLEEALSFSGEMYLCLKDESGNISFEKNVYPKSKLYNHVISVYKDKISILHKGEGNDYAVVIQSKEIADIHKIIFNVARNGFNMKDDDS
ncbi:MAG: helix-turn-helix domain-containing protein [Nitrospirota bacterium]